MVFIDMEFCPDCGAMLMPKKGKIKCRCGYEKKLTNDDIEEQYHMEGETNPQAKVIVTDNINNQVPGIYSVTYSATNEQGFSASASRTVYVAAESGIVNLYVGEMWTPKGSYLSGGTHLITDNGDGTYQMDDIMGGYYCWYTYPGYDAMGYDFFAEFNFSLAADGTMTQVGDVGDWYFAGQVELSLMSGKYDSATGVVSFSSSYGGQELKVVLTPVTK